MIVVLLGANKLTSCTGGASPAVGVQALKCLQGKVAKEASSKESAFAVCGCQPTRNRTPVLRAPSNRLRLFILHIVHAQCFVPSVGPQSSMACALSVKVREPGRSERLTTHLVRFGTSLSHNIAVRLRRSIDRYNCLFSRQR